ncbi:ATP-binding protein, partial [candidate division KSB1 bacterium]
SVINTTDDGVLITDSDYKVVIRNKAFLKIFGYKENDISERSFYDFLQDDCRGECEGLFRILEDAGEHSDGPFTSELTGKTRNGKTFPFKISISGWKLSSNTFYTLIIRDVSDLKNAEDILIKKQGELGEKLKYESLLANISARLNTDDYLDIVLNEIAKKICLVTKVDEVRLIFLGGKDETFDLEAGEEITGYPKNSLRISPLMEVSRLIENIRSGTVFISGDFSEFSKKEIQQIEKLKLRSFLILPVRIMGNVSGMMIFGRRSDSEWTPGIYALFKTITDIIAGAWERNNHFNAKLRAEQKQIEAFRLAEQSSRLASLGTLAAGMAHEINQPLTAIKITVDGMLYWEEMNKKIPQDEVSPNIKFISEQVNRIEEMITQIRILAKGDKQENAVQLNINDIVDQSLSFIKAQLAAHKIKISLQFDRSLPEIMGIPSQMKRAVSNLVINAMHALDNIERDNKKIIILTKNDSENCYIEITDNGPGIPEEYIDHIFDPFFTTRVGAEGMGLGLSIAQNIISGFGGQISVENLPEEGARFTVSLPVSN